MKSSFRLRSEFIAELYDAAVDTAAWQRLPEALARTLEGDSAVVSFENIKLATVEGITSGIPAQAMSLYAAHYHKVNPWIEAWDQRRLSFEAVLGTDLVPEIALRQTEFFTDFARKFDTFHVAAGHVRVGHGRALFGVHRQLSTSRFGSAHRTALRHLLPHMQRAVQIRGRLEGIDATGLGFAALETLAIGTVICDTAGRILFANTAAVTIAARCGGIVLGGSRHGIGAEVGVEGKRLATLIAAAVRGGDGGVTALTQRDGGRLFVLVSPVPRRLSEEPGRALIMLRSAGGRPVVEVATLARLFGLTVSEAEVAQALLTGQSLGEIAAARHVSKTTVRTHMARLLRKTETTGQRDLVRVLGLIPPVR